MTDASEAQRRALVPNRNVPNVFYPVVGRCIYCDATQVSAGAIRFTDEHIIPLALGGNLVLPEASCHNCASIINQQIETPVLFKEWGYLRIKRNFPSRSRKRKAAPRREYVTLTTRDGRPMRVPVWQYSCPVPLYKFKEARILTGQPPGDDNYHWTMEILSSPDEEMQMQRKFPEWNRQHLIRAQPFQFARLMAKIAYSYSVAEYGLGAFTPLVVDIIRGRSDDYFHTVGGALEIQPAIPGGDHVTNIGILFRSAKQALLIVEVRLFSQIRTPNYHVVVGEIDLDKPEHAAALQRHRVAGRLGI